MPLQAHGHIFFVFVHFVDDIQILLGQKQEETSYKLVESEKGVVLELGLEVRMNPLHYTMALGHFACTPRPEPISYIQQMKLWYISGELFNGTVICCSNLATKQ